jgi:RNA polymerase sigma-70 factor, ECF subfamily
VQQTETMPQEGASQDSLYEQVAEAYSPALDRLARAYELDNETRRDLLQEIHFHLWRSFSKFDQRCSLRTWVYRVAHNVATTHVIRQRRIRETLVNLEDVETVENLADDQQSDLAISQNQALERLSKLIQRLKPLDRQIIVSYLEGMPASAISEITGLSPANVAMKVHRVTKILKRQFGERQFGERQFGEGGVHAE